MNLHSIVKYVGDFVPAAKRIRATTSGGLYVLRCEIGTRTHTVQFTDVGLYGEEPVISTDGARSEIHIASDIAKELRK